MTAPLPGGHVLVVVRRRRTLGRDPDPASIEAAFREADAASPGVQLIGPHARIVVVARAGHGDSNEAAWAVDVRPPASVQLFADTLLRKLRDAHWEAITGTWDAVEVYAYDPARMGPWSAWEDGTAWPTRTRDAAPELLDRLRDNEDVMRPAGTLQDAPGAAVPEYVARVGGAVAGSLLPLVLGAAAVYAAVYGLPMLRSRSGSRAR